MFGTSGAVSKKIQWEDQQGNPIKNFSFPPKNAVIESYFFNQWDNILTSEIINNKMY